MPFYCCAVCQEILAEESENLAYIWVNLCAKSIVYNNRIPIKIENSLEESLYDLETSGFIDTHETNEYILVKLNGYFIDDRYEFHFCIDYDEHCKEDM